MQQRQRIFLKHFAWRAAWWAILPAAFLGMRFGWALEAGHRLAGEQAALRAQGIPVTSAELPDPGKVPPDEDAVPLFLRAMSGFKLNLADRGLVGLLGQNVNLDRVRFTPGEVADLRRIWGENAGVIADLDLSEARPQCAWPTDFDVYFGPNSQLPGVSSRLLAQLLAERALLDALDHRDADALQHLHRIMNLARIEGAQPSFLGYLIGTSIRSMALEVFERLEPRFDWQDSQVIAAGGVLLRDFLAADQGDFLRAWLPEFAFLHYWVGKRPQAIEWWLGPLFEDDEARALGIYAANLPALRAASFPEFKARLIPAPPAGASQFARTVAVYSRDTEFGESFGRLYYQRAGDVAAAQMLLAARLYQCALGRWPASAADLAPRFLPRLPRDLFDPGGQPMRYRLDPAGPTVWSVGENGTDEGGAGLLAGNGSFRYGRHPDIVYGAAWREFLATLPVP